ncbi:MAG: DUF1800 domain-containing protein [Phycisphaerae bacterium]
MNLIVPRLFLACFAAASSGASPGQAQSSGVWTYAQAAHLAARAGFGAAPAQIQALVDMGRRAAVESLLNASESGPPPAIERLEPPDRMELRAKSEDERQQLRMERNQTEQIQLQVLRRWWVRRMVESAAPLEEKMTLFWHGHFTSGAREVKSAYLLYRQNELFRRHATGNFRDLLLAVSRDPAMLLYLNSAQNNKNHPNENYARELMELFTLGIGHYTEQDIRESARAFTGWSLDRGSGEFLFRPGMHDYGRKTFLGVTGNLNGDDVVDTILAQPRTAEYLCQRLWVFFASEEPPPGVVRSLATTLRKHRYEIKPVLRAMFSHPAFYSPRVMAAHVKSPVELLVGTLRALETPSRDYDAMVLGLRQMGQDLFQPPNVKGWDGGLKWINAATLYNRYNVAGRLIGGTEASAALRGMMVGPKMRERAREMGVEPTPAQSAYDPMPVIRAAKLGSPVAVVDHFVLRLIGRPIAAERRDRLVKLLEESLSDPRRVDAASNAGAIRELLQVIVSMSEFQLS